MTIGQTDFLQGGGHMGARMRDFDWAGHPLGAPEAWPQALRIVVRLILTTGHPALIFWGPDLYCLYNDGFAELMGPEKHPAMLGQPARAMWQEAWPIVSGDIEQVMAGEGSAFQEDQLIPIQRNGRLEEIYWTYSQSPIEDEGVVGGVLVLCTETTSRVRENQRRATDRERQQRLFEQAPGFIIIMRGPDHLVEFVNDAHRRVFGSDEWIGKTLRNAFPSIEGQGFFETLDRVYATGETFEADGIPVRYRRSPEALEETHHLSFIYAPLYDEQGTISGIFCEGFDVSQSKHAEIRHAALAELADRVRDLSAPEEIAFAAAETLGRALGVGRAGYGTIDIDAETIRIERDWNAPGIRSIAGTLHFRDFGSYIDDLKAGRTAVVEDARTDPRTIDTAAALEGIQARSFVNMPVTEQGGFVALLFLNHEHARSWSPDELALIREFAERTRTMVARREAEAAVASNEARLRFLDALATATASATDGDAVMQVTVELLGQHLAVSDCAYADMDADEDMFTIRGDWHAADERSIVGRYSLTTFGTLAVANLHAGKPLIVNDNVEELGEDGAQAFLDIGIRATICMPYIKDGRLTALMAIHDSKPRWWSEDELNLLREVTERSWAHIERVRTEAALRDSERRLRLAIEGARMGTWEWDLATMKGTWSDRTAEIMGVASGGTVTPEQRFQLIHPDDRESVRETFRGAIAEHRQIVSEYRVVRPDGVVRWIASRGLAVYNDDGGTALRIIGTVRDVTERRQTQEALHALNTTLEQQVARRTAERDRMWRLSGDLFLVVGKRWEIRAANPALEPLLGYAPEEVLGERFSRYVHPDDRSSIARALRAASHGPLRDFEARLQAKDGSWRRFAWSAAPGDGEAYVIGRDVTEESERREELERAQEALRQSQKMESLGQLTGGVAHDFNNLLTPIIGSLDLLRRRETGEREQRLIGAALESAERARTLVQRLLAFARRQPLQPGAVDLASLVGGMAALIASTSGPQINLAVDIPENLPPAHADANQLEMAVLNLSVNARDAMPSGGRLTIAGSEERIGATHRTGLPEGRYVRLSVADTGVGMNAETLARAVEPFFSTKGLGKGTGLGLSMVHGLASQLGGAMLLSSRPGLGTVAELFLPIAEGPAAPAEVRAAARLEGAGTVLLVDDEPAVRASTAELLRDLGYAVVEAGNAQEALDSIGQRVPDYLVTDHLMPGINGTDLARIVRQKHPLLPVLVVSGYAELDAISPDLPRLAKPFRQDELAAIMTSLV